MRFGLVNRSGYDTGDLRRFIARYLHASGVTPRSARTLRFVVTSSPIRSRGCAEVGGDVVSLAIGSPSRFSMRRLCRLLEHEMAHRRGLEHRQMNEKLLYSLGGIPTWARGLRIRYRGRAPDQMFVLR